MDRAELLRAATAIYCDFQTCGSLSIEKAVDEAKQLLRAVDEACPEPEWPLRSSPYDEWPKENTISRRDYLMCFDEVRALVEAARRAVDDYAMGKRDRLPRALAPFEEWDEMTSLGWSK